MKAAVFYGPGDLRYEDVPVPSPGPGPLLWRGLENYETRIWFHVSVLFWDGCNRIAAFVPTATRGNEFFRATFDEAEPSPAVQSGACRG